MTKHFGFILQAMVKSFKQENGMVTFYKNHSGSHMEDVLGKADSGGKIIYKVQATE